MLTGLIVVITSKAYANIESLCCTRDTNTMSYLNNISNKENNRKKHTKSQGENIYNTHS